MNIFVVHSCPIEAARSLHDRHVVKMILEAAQMLCSVAHGLGRQLHWPASEVLAFLLPSAAWFCLLLWEARSLRRKLARLDAGASWWPD